MRGECTAQVPAGGAQIVRAPPGFWHHAAVNFEWIFMFFAKSGKSVTAVTWVRTSFLPKAAAAGVPPPNESIVEEIGDQRIRI